MFLLLKYSGKKKKKLIDLNNSNELHKLCFRIGEVPDLE